MSEPTLTTEALLRTVVIVAKWLPGPDGLRREVAGRVELRMGPQAFERMKSSVPRHELDAPGTIFGCVVEYEDLPPVDLIEQVMGPQVDFKTFANRTLDDVAEGLGMPRPNTEEV